MKDIAEVIVIAAMAFVWTMFAVVIRMATRALAAVIAVTSIVTAEPAHNLMIVDSTPAAVMEIATAVLALTMAMNAATVLATFAIN